jgi:hypothetical protein
MRESKHKSVVFIFPPFIFPPMKDIRVFSAPSRLRGKKKMPKIVGSKKKEGKEKK